MSVQVIKGFVHAETGWEGANVSCIQTGEGLVLVDTPLLPGDAETWRSYVLGLDPRGVKYIVNTDYHFDHVLGNRRFGATVISHRVSRDRMLEEDGTLRAAMIDSFPSRTPEQKAFIVSEPLVPAHITFEAGLTLHLGGRRIEVSYTPGHTPGTVCVHLPEEGILLTGDTVSSNLHPYKGQADFARWEESLGRLAVLDADVIVPGHGEVCSRAELERFAAYFRDLRGVTAALAEQGKGRDEVIREVRARLLGAFPVDPEMRPTAERMFDEGTGRLYDEIASRGRETGTARR